jgi:hypothetical protein
MTRSKQGDNIIILLRLLGMSSLTFSRHGRLRRLRMHILKQESSASIVIDRFFFLERKIMILKIHFLFHDLKALPDLDWNWNITNKK